MALVGPDAGDDSVHVQVEPEGVVAVAWMAAVDEERHFRVTGQEPYDAGDDGLGGGVGEVAKEEDSPAEPWRGALFPCRGHGGKVRCVVALQPDDVDGLAAEGHVASEEPLVPRLAVVVVEDRHPAFVDCA